MKFTFHYQQTNNTQQRHAAAIFIFAVLKGSRWCGEVRKEKCAGPIINVDVCDVVGSFWSSIMKHVQLLQLWIQISTALFSQVNKHRQDCELFSLLVAFFTINNNGSGQISSKFADSSYFDDWPFNSCMPFRRPIALMFKFFLNEN